jgi:hypothetical protein
MASHIMNNVKNWLSYIKREFGADDIMLIDKRGLPVSYSLDNESKRIELLLQTLGNYSLSLDNFLKNMIKDNISYTLIETNNKIMIVSRLNSGKDPYYIVITFKNQEIPVGIILMRLEGIRENFREIYENWGKMDEKEERNKTVNISGEDEIMELIRKIEKHPLFKMIINNYREED